MILAMTTKRTVRGWAGGLGLFALASAGVTQLHAQSPSINQRPTIARALIGSSRIRSGDFKSAGTSGICGEMPKEVMGIARFVIEFPSDVVPGATLMSIAFGSDQLVGRVTKATVFRLNVNVKTANGGTPPAYVLNTDGTIPNSSGTATLTPGANGAVTLRVVGQERDGETIDLTVTCS